MINCNNIAIDEVFSRFVEFVKYSRHKINLYYLYALLEKSLNITSCEKNTALPVVNIIRIIFNE